MLGDKEFELRDLVKGLREDVDTRFTDLKSQFDVAHKKTTEAVTERPLLTLAVAIIGGVVLGIALTRSRD